MKSILSLLVLLLAGVALAASSGGSRLLALFDDLSEKESYSLFLGDLESEFPADGDSSKA
jgi:oligosaccharyltransferase complex subunit beta